MKLNKKIALLLVLVMIAAMFAGCAGKKDDQSDALTEKEYEDEVTALTEKLSSIQNDAAALDPNDEEAAKKLLGEMKQPFSDFMSVTPPEKYEDAHEKMKSGSQAMIDYIDTVTSILGETDTEKLQKASEKMMEQLQTAMTDLTEGAAMLAE